MQGTDILLLVVFLVTFLAAVQLLRGKWLMLIAGYNTAGKDEREKINGRNLGKLMAAMLFFSDFMIVGMRFLDFNENVSAIVLTIVVFICIVFANVSPIFKN
ncbi:DUF3784 domain-containing protein [Enterococcus sp. LJL90]